MTLKGLCPAGAVGAYKHQSFMQVLAVVMHVLTLSALSVTRYPRLHAMQTAAFVVLQFD
jgi:hypothetical protein